MSESGVPCRVELLVEKAYCDQWQIFMVGFDGAGNPTHVAKIQTLEWVPYHDGMQVEPIARTKFGYESKKFAEMLQNLCTREGMIPETARRYEAEIEATKKHLDDLRALVFRYEPVNRIEVPKGIPEGRVAVKP